MRAGGGVRHYGDAARVRRVGEQAYHGEGAVAGACHALLEERGNGGGAEDEREALDSAVTLVDVGWDPADGEGRGGGRRLGHITGRSCTK